MYSTTAGESFQAPARVQASKPQIGVLIRDGLRNFDRQSVYTPQRFGECRSPIKTNAKFDAISTHNLDFGSRTKLSYVEKRTATSASRNAAGGHPGIAPSKKDTDAIEEEKRKSEERTARNAQRQITFGITALHYDLRRIGEKSVFQDEH